MKKVEKWCSRFVVDVKCKILRKFLNRKTNFKMDQEYSNSDLDYSGEKTAGECLAHDQTTSNRGKMTEI